MSRTGPFGLAMGMSIDDFDGKLEEVGVGNYRAHTVPKPHSAFDIYVLQITPHQGLSWIKAVGRNVATSAYGIELQTAFDSMKSKLEAAYGAHELMDFVFADSIWNEPRDWMSGLLNRERVLTAIWQAKCHSSLTNSLESILLAANAADTSTGYLSLEYTFQNCDEADGALAAMEDDAL